MISKELLSEVIGAYNVKSTSYNKIGKKVSYSGRTDIVGDYYASINIYELAHKCKEWAIKEKNVFEIKSGFYGSFYECKLRLSNNSPSFTISCDTEPEAIFKACQWILEQSK